MVGIAGKALTRTSTKIEHQGMLETALQQKGQRQPRARAMDVRRVQDLRGSGPPTRALQKGHPVTTGTNTLMQTKEDLELLHSVFPLKSHHFVRYELTCLINVHKKTRKNWENEE